MAKAGKKQTHLVDCLSGLWQWQQPNSELEKAFNMIVSQLEPNCSICLFFTRQQVQCTVLLETIIILVGVGGGMGYFHPKLTIRVFGPIWSGKDYTLYSLLEKSERWYGFRKESVEVP